MAGPAAVVAYAVRGKIHGGIGLFERDARRDASHREQALIEAIVGRVLGGGHGEGDPEIAWEDRIEASRHDADDAIRFAVENHGPAENRRIAAKDPSPCRVLEDGNVIPVGTVFFRRKRAPELRMRTEHVEPLPAHAGSLQAERAVAGHIVEAAAPAKAAAWKTLCRSWMSSKSGVETGMLFRLSLL